MPDEQNYGELAKDRENIYKKLDEEIKLSDYDITFTHNIDGEYEHGNHKILGEYFKEKAEKENSNVWHFLCPAIQNLREKKVGENVESTFLNSALLEQKYLIFQFSYITQRFLWTGCCDFMRFQFCSGVEMFTHF